MSVTTDQTRRATSQWRRNEGALLLGPTMSSSTRCCTEAATIGSVVNLVVIAWMRHLRNRPSAQWRKRERSAKEKRSERLQIILAIVTLILVGLEMGTHPMVHRKGPPPPCRIAHTC